MGFRAIPPPAKQFSSRLGRMFPAFNFLRKHSPDPCPALWWSLALPPIEQRVPAQVDARLSHGVTHLHCIIPATCGGHAWTSLW